MKASSIHSRLLVLKAFYFSCHPFLVTILLYRFSTAISKFFPYCRSPKQAISWIASHLQARYVSKQLISQARLLAEINLCCKNELEKLLLPQFSAYRLQHGVAQLQRGWLWHAQARLGVLGNVFLSSFSPPKNPPWPLLPIYKPKLPNCKPNFLCRFVGKKDFPCLRRVYLPPTSYTLWTIFQNCF